METKPWWQSKTIIFNILSGLIGIVASLQADKGVPPHVAEVFGSIVMVGNIALRFFTDTAIGGSK